MAFLWDLHPSSSQEPWANVTPDSPKAADSLSRQLHAAVEREDCAAIYFLFDKGADVNAAEASFGEQTPLMKAVARGSTACMEALLSQHPRLDLADSDGKTALHIAAEHFSLPALQILLREGAPVHLADLQGHTPLDLAAAEGREQFLEPLLRGCGGMGEQLRLGRAALDSAIKEGTPSSRQAACMLFKLLVNIASRGPLEELDQEHMARRQSEQAVQSVHRDLAQVRAELQAKSQELKAAREQLAQESTRMNLKLAQARSEHARELGGACEAHAEALAAQQGEHAAALAAVREEHRAALAAATGRLAVEQRWKNVWRLLAGGLGAGTHSGGRDQKQQGHRHRQGPGK